MSNASSLKAMAEGKEEGINKATIYKVQPHRVEFEDGFNLREEGPELDAHIEALYQSMKAGATIPPIDVSIVDGKIIARDGHCRTRAAKRLVADGIPYLLETRQFRGNEAECVFHMISSSQGKPLSPMESGRGFLRLVKYGQTIPQIVARTALSRATIDNGIALAEAPVEVQKMISSGAVATSVALDTLRKHGAKAGPALKEIVDKVSAGGTKKVTKKHITEKKVPERIVHTFKSAIENIRLSLSADDLTELAGATAESLKGRMVLVPAGELKSLLELKPQ